MIGVYFKGRLGNQIFQYVFYRYLKQENRKKLVFFVNPHHAYLAKYFELEKYQYFTLQSKIYSAITRCMPFVFGLKDIFIQNFVYPRKIEAENFSVYNGYFQTDWYLNHLKEKPKLILKQRYVKMFDHLYGETFKTEKNIVVHIRRTDYLNYGKRDISLPIGYFQDRLNEIENLDEYKVFFVSDDIPFVKSTFAERPNFIFSSHEEIIDFQLIQNADIAIISNSSFAWWAAYLSPKNNKVIAPKNWMGFRIGAEHPKGVMTDKFTWVDVFTPQESNL